MNQLRLLRFTCTIACVAACDRADSRTPTPDTSHDAAPSTCGDGSVDDGERCDPGTPAACAELGGTWNDGMAACRADCSGWNVSACVRIDATQWETVEPAVRDPRWATARCNDGTPFDFNVQLAPESSKVWVIHLAGGGACMTFRTSAARVIAC